MESVTNSLKGRKGMRLGKVCLSKRMTIDIKEESGMVMWTGIDDKITSC